MSCPELRKVLRIGALGVALTGCGASPPVVRTALHGDLPTLKREVLAARKSGTIDADLVNQLAWAVAGREVRSARGPDGASRMKGLLGCADQLASVIEERASHRDDAGAAATLLLIDAGRLDPVPLVKEYVTSADGAWRAVGARGTFDRAHASLRRRLLADPDQRVRRTALDAAFTAADSGDTDSLLEVLRVDPDPLCQSKAARALGAIGGPRAVLGLKDRFPTADEMLGSSIADAWAMPHAFRAGGEHELLSVVETAEGLPALTASLALVRAASGESAKIGAGALVQILEHGTSGERLAALGAAPLSDPRVRAAVKKSARGSDPLVRIAALRRLATLPSARKQAVAALRKLTRSDGPSKQAAALALADVHDASGVSTLDASLKERSSSKREQAALALLELDRYPSVATALADDDPSVRSSVACSVLARDP